MKNPLLSRLGLDRASCLALLAGCLVGLSFSRLNLAAAAWIGLVPLFAVMDRRPFRSGFVAGVGFFALVLYWLNIVMVTFGKLHPLLSLVAYVLLVAYLALFFGAATWAAWRLEEKLGYPRVVTLPVLWVALEFIRSFLFTGFPWATLGYSQHSLLPMIQSADLFGVYGLSFLLVLVNAAFAQAWIGFRKGDVGGLAVRSLAVAAALVGLNLAYGYARLDAGLAQRDETVTVGLIQGNIDQSLKWNPAFQEATVAIYRGLSEEAAAGGNADLLVWPESATPFYFQERNPLSLEVGQVPVQTGAYLLFGSPAYERKNRSFKYLNSAYLLSPEGKVLGRSDKVHLVPFGEYVPLGPFLPFVDKLVEGIGDFSPGTVSPLAMNGHQVGVLVCFEGIFPELARDYVLKGSELLVNITNDAWFGRSSAPWQHLAMTRFRAVENRIWVVRAANTGISALIDPDGRVTGMTPLFETTYLRGEAGLGAEATLYTRVGDLLPALFAALAVFWLARSRRRLPQDP